MPMVMVACKNIWASREVEVIESDALVVAMLYKYCRECLPHVTTDVLDAVIKERQRAERLTIRDFDAAVATVRDVKALVTTRQPGVFQVLAKFVVRGVESSLFHRFMTVRAGTGVLFT